MIKFRGHARLREPGYVDPLLILITDKHGTCRYTKSISLLIQDKQATIHFTPPPPKCFDVQMCLQQLVNTFN